ncbi:sulfotransferase 1E1-like [Ornithodoros turicata]|uniref:sulfotransferase 1E1-like n=1 Tax=Ornithodoros turicata TaxID=34597 RepID=UPI003138F816
MSRDHYHTVDGLFVPKLFPAESIREALAYEPRPDDVFIVAYPKCGTTWMQHIVYHIFSKGTPSEDPEEFQSKTPFFEMKGQEGVENLPRPAAIKTHLPFNKQPYSAEAKYVYITRNPYDCCVSFFYHVRMILTLHYENGSFDDFFEKFLKGEVPFGNYFDYLLSWYPHRDDPNVLFLTYEELKRDVRSSIQKIADFLGDEYGEVLRRDPSALERIVDLTSFENMQKVVNPIMRDFGRRFRGIPVEAMPLWTQRMIRSCGEEILKPSQGDFVRKGKVGGWRDHFTPVQAERMKEWIKKSTAGSDVMDLWKDINFDY